MLELENLDDASFSELVKKSVSEIPEFYPEWTDFNAHDPGITFLEMLMWLTEMQRYYLSQITESNLKSYLKLLGTSVRAAEPSVILARLFPEELIFLKNGTVFKIGEIPYKLTEDAVIAPYAPEVFFEENIPLTIFIRQKLEPFKGRKLPLYFSFNESTCANPMKEGFYPQAEIAAGIKEGSDWIECGAEDETYGFYQSGFVNISVPGDVGGDTSLLRLQFISDEGFNLPRISFFSSNICRLIQLDENGETLGENGRVKENLAFSADFGGRKISAATYREIKAGRNGETPQEAFARYKSEQSRLPRAVSRDDYRRLIRETPGLRAEIINVFSREAGKVSVCVQTDGGRGLSKSEEKNMRKVLFEAKPAGTEIEILPAVKFSARLFISARTDGWAGEKRLSDHIRKIFSPLEKCMGVKINMPEIVKEIRESPFAVEIKNVVLRFGRGVELNERDVMALPEDGILSLDEIITQ